MNKNLLIGIGVVALGGGIVLYCHYKPILDRKKLIRLFTEKNYTYVSESLTPEEQKKLEVAISNLSDKEQKTLLSAYVNGTNDSDIDELRRILDKLKPVMDEIKPAFDIKRIEYGTKDITIYVKNAENPNITFNYGQQINNMKIPLVKAGKDGTSLMTLKYSDGKLSAYEGDTKIQEEEIIEKKQIPNINKPKT